MPAGRDLDVISVYREYPFGQCETLFGAFFEGLSWATRARTASRKRALNERSLVNGILTVRIRLS